MTQPPPHSSLLGEALKISYRFLKINRSKLTAYVEALVSF